MLTPMPYFNDVHMVTEKHISDRVSVLKKHQYMTLSLFNTCQQYYKRPVVLVKGGPVTEKHKSVTFYLFSKSTSK